MPQQWFAPQHMDLPDTDPKDLQLAEFHGTDAIRLCHIGTVTENKNLYSAHRTDHGKMNSWARNMESKMEWGDRSTGGNWEQPDFHDRRYWGSSPYRSPFKNAEHNTAWNNDAKCESGKLVARPRYSNLTYRPNDPKGDGKGDKGERTADTASLLSDSAAAAASTEPPPRQEARGIHTERSTAPDTAVVQSKSMPTIRRTRVVAKPGAFDEEEENAEIEAAIQASTQALPYVERVNTILESDSPTTVFNKAFGDYGSMDQTEIDATLNLLQDKVTRDTLAGVVHVVQGYTETANEEDTADTGSKIQLILDLLE
eukprot:6089306-Amphidinium_carterae.2